jgi:hypothetical protein
MLSVQQFLLLLQITKHVRQIVINQLGMNDEISNFFQNNRIKISPRFIQEKFGEQFEYDGNSIYSSAKKIHLEEKCLAFK